MTRSNNDDERRSKIVLVNGSRLLREMLGRIFQKLPDFEIVGNLHDLADLDSLDLSTEIDWLVVSAASHAAISDGILEISARHPGIRILTIAADGSEVLVDGQRSREMCLEEVALPELLALMRSGSHESPGWSE